MRSLLHRAAVIPAKSGAGSRGHSSVFLLHLFDFHLTFVVVEIVHIFLFLWFVELIDYPTSGSNFDSQYHVVSPFSNAA